MLTASERCSLVCVLLALPVNSACPDWLLSHLALGTFFSCKMDTVFCVVSLLYFPSPLSQAFLASLLFSPRCLDCLCCTSVLWKWLVCVLSSNGNCNWCLAKKYLVGKGRCHQGVHPPVSYTTAYRVLAGIELITAFYGCLYAGCIPVTVRPPHAQSLAATLPTVRMIVEVSNGAVAESMAGALLLQLLRLEWLT